MHGGRLSNEELTAALEEAFTAKTAAEGEIARHLGEVDRRETFRDDGATSTEAWTVERFGVSAPTARALTHVGEKACGLPHLVGPSVRARSPWTRSARWPTWPPRRATEELCERAKVRTVRELAEVARQRPADAGPRRSAPAHERRYLRFNDTFRTMSAQLPAEAYAEAKACLEARAKAIPSDGETPVGPASR